MGKKRIQKTKEIIVRDFMSWGVSYDKAWSYVNNLSGRKLQIKMAQVHYKYNNNIEKNEFFDRAKNVEWNLKKKDINTKTKRNALLPELEKREVEHNKNNNISYIIITYEGLIEKDHGVEKYLDKVLSKKSNKDMEEYILKVIKEGKSFGKLGDIFMATSNDFENKSLADVISELGKSGKFVVYHGIPRTPRQFLKVLLMLVTLVYQPIEKEGSAISFCELVAENVRIESVRKKALRMGERI